MQIRQIGVFWIDIRVHDFFGIVLADFEGKDLEDWLGGRAVLSEVEVEKEL